MTTRLDDQVIACTLGTDDLKARLQRIAALANRFLLKHQQDGPTHRLRYDKPAAAELKEIVALERQCCAFLIFELVEKIDWVDLTITAPTEAGETAAFLFEHFVALATPPLPHCALTCGCGSGP